MAETDQATIALSCDDSYLSLVATVDEQEGQTESIMSDEEFAEHLQFQEALMGSILASKNKQCSSSQTVISKTEKGETSGTKKDELSLTLCEICADKKPDNEMFNVLECTHRYCIDCVAKHIAVKVQKSVQGTTMFTCPGLGCECVLDIENCRGILPKYVLLVWDSAICEGLIDESQKFYCPYKDCSGLILNDGDEVIRESECPFCHRLFCAQCKVPWHSDYPCEEFQKLDKNERTREDLMMHELAKSEKWQRCPKCKFFVEKMDGCLHMECRCKHEFCYACGETWTRTHGGCQPQELHQ